MATQKRTDIDIEHFRSRLMEERAIAEQTISVSAGLEPLKGREC